jgi:hypothetical protein
MNNLTKSWTLEVMEDPDNKDELILQFPPDLLESAGWKEGDVLIWSITDDGITLSKKQTDL